MPRRPLAAAAILATLWLAGSSLGAAPPNPAGEMSLIEILAGHVYDRKVYAADGHTAGRQILEFGVLEPQSDGRIQGPVVIEGFDAADRRTSTYRLRLTGQLEASWMVLNFVSIPRAGAPRIAFQVSGPPLVYPAHSSAGTLLTGDGSGAVPSNGRRVNVGATSR